MTRFQFDYGIHGAGGFAKIFKGRDTFLERDVAVKVLRPSSGQFSDEDRERFKREARILAQLSHPNIPAIYDVEFEEDFLIIFEFIQGISLAQFIEDQGPCSLAQARSWFSQIASALQHAHSNDIIHRDIKPSNIMIKPDFETAYLIDFGIALCTADGDRITDYGWVVGTPGYMSPEQESGEQLDHRTDIFSLGVTIYEALAGRRPGLGTYDPLSLTEETIPEQIDILIQDCLLPEDQRVSSASAFSERLAGALRMRKPFSVVLAQGRLYELSLALKAEDFTADTLAGLPDGQTALLLVKLESIICSDDENLSFPCAELLETMLVKGMRLEVEEYRRIVRPAVEWAFEKVYPYPGSPSMGKRSLQDALKDVCLRAGHGTHQVLREELEEFVQGIDLAEKENWYLHSLREVLSALLANSAFTSDPTGIASFLTAINEEQRSREQSQG